VAGALPEVSSRLCSSSCQAVSNDVYSAPSLENAISDPRKRYLSSFYFQSFNVI